VAENYKPDRKGINTINSGEKLIFANPKKGGIAIAR